MTTITTKSPSVDIINPFDLVDIRQTEANQSKLNKVMTTVTSKSSSVIISATFDPTNEQVILKFVSNPDKDYVYNIFDGEYEYVVSAFSNADSHGKVYHQLVSKNVIAPAV